MMRRFPFLAAAVFLGVAYAMPANADSIGDRRTFNVSSTYDAAGESEIPATLRAAGSMAYVYVDDRYWNALTSSVQSSYLERLQQLATVFSDTIRPISVSFWGSEPTPGVDGDPRVTILVQQLVSGSGGYFQTINLYSREQAPESNEREMVIISAESVNTSLGRDFTAHEFQHLISFNQRELTHGESDDVWLNELRSEFNITAVGFSYPYGGSALERRAFSFLRTPSDSLTEWPNSVTDYGIASLFGHYLNDRYGGAILQHTIHTRERGVRSINEWLAARSRPERFRDVFADWMAAVVVNDSRDPRYGYVTTGLNAIRLAPPHTSRLDASSWSRWDLELKAWQPDWMRFDMPSGMAPSPTLTVQVTGRSEADWGGTYIADYSGTMQVVPWRAGSGRATIQVPTSSGERALRAVTFAIVHGTDATVQDRMFEAFPVTVSATLDPSAAGAVPAPSAAPMPPSTSVRDGDLVRKGTEKEVYVIWGVYKRFMVPGTLELYGFQDRPVISLAPEVFDSYRSSNYIRQVDTEPVYAVWPDGTKHHLAITAAQWDASGRDWNAIFIVNEREATFYPIGESITR